MASWVSPHLVSNLSVTTPEDARRQPETHVPPTLSLCTDPSQVLFQLSELGFESFRPDMSF